MTYKEVLEVLGKVKALFPQSKIGESKEALEIVAEVWYEGLGSFPREVIEKALKIYCFNDKTGYAPQIANLIDIIRQRSESRLDSAEITRLLKRALSNSCYNSTAEFDRLPDDLKRVVGNAGELHYQSMRDLRESEIYIKSVIKEYNARVENGTLDNTLLIGQNNFKELMMNEER